MKIIKKIFLFLLYFLGSIFVLIFLFLCILFVPRYLYTPPALTQQKLAAYTQAIEFITKMDRSSVYFSFRKDMNTSYIVINGEDYYSDKKDKLIPVIGENLYKELEELRSAMFYHTDGIVKSNDNYILFETDQTLDPIEVPGAVYSMDGTDPNSVAEDSILYKYKPFEHIHGNWYLSKRLHRRFMTRYGYRSPIPSSLIDRSLEWPGEPEKAGSPK